jgi:hypothetical protein
MDDQARPKGSFDDFTLRSDALDALDIIAEQLRTKRAITPQDIELFLRESEAVQKRAEEAILTSENTLRAVKRCSTTSSPRNCPIVASAKPTLTLHELAASSATVGSLQSFPIHRHETPVKPARTAAKLRGGVKIFRARGRGLAPPRPRRIASDSSDVAVNAAANALQAPVPAFEDAISPRTVIGARRVNTEFALIRDRRMVVAVRRRRRFGTWLVVVLIAHPTPTLAADPLPLLRPLEASYAWLQAVDAGQTLTRGPIHEALPWMQTLADHPPALISTKAAVTAATLALSESLRVRHPRLALVVLVSLNSALTGVITHNAAVQRRGVTGQVIPAR